MTLALTIDVTEELPTLADLRAYRIATMAVVASGPGGGHPCVTLGFDGGRADALRFLAGWYGSADPAADLAVATGA